MIFHQHRNEETECVVAEGRVFCDVLQETVEVVAFDRNCRGQEERREGCEGLRGGCEEGR